MAIVACSVHTRFRDCMVHQRKCNTFYKPKHLPRTCTCALQANLLRSLLRVRVFGSMLNHLKPFQNMPEACNKAALHLCKVSIDRLGLPVRFARSAVPYQSIAQTHPIVLLTGTKTTHPPARRQRYSIADQPASRDVQLKYLKGIRAVPRLLPVEGC